MSSNEFPKRLSPTSIDRWRQCPRRFLYQDVQQLKFHDITTYEQTLGEVVHKTLERVLRLPSAQRTEEAAERNLEWSLLRFAATGAVAEDDRDRLREEASTQVLRYVRGDGAHAQVLKVEASFQLSIKSGTVIRTRVDRVDSGESGLLHVVDYKTGRHQIDDGELGREIAPIVQLLAVGKASEIPVEKVVWIYLRSGESISWWPEPDDVDFAVERLLNVLRQMYHDSEFEPNPGGHCVTCPFTRICPAWSDEGEGCGQILEAA